MFCQDECERGRRQFNSQHAQIGHGTQRGGDRSQIVGIDFPNKKKRKKRRYGHEVFVEEIGAGNHSQLGQSSKLVDLAGQCRNLVFVNVENSEAAQFKELQGKGGDIIGGQKAVKG